MEDFLLATLVGVLRAHRSRRVARKVEELVQALDALPDDTMRHARLHSSLIDLPDDVALEILNGMLLGAQNDRPRFRAVVGALLDLGPLLADLGPERLELWRLRARELDLTAISALLSTREPRRRYYAPNHMDVNEQLETPLGRRKSLARSFNRQVLDRVLFDKHPGVLRILLDNPRIVERDVVRIAALQPTSDAALQAVFSHPRWIRRYPIKKALVFNPYCSIATVQSLLGFLLEPDLALASRAKQLAPEVRERAKTLLLERIARRRGGRAPDPASLPRTRPHPAEDALARDFLATIPDAELTLLSLEPEEEVEDESVAEEFLRSLRGTIRLVPVGEDDDLEEEDRDAEE